MAVIIATTIIIFDIIIFTIMMIWGLGGWEGCTYDALGMHLRYSRD